MPKLPSFRRLFREDYPDEQKGLIDKLSVTINQGLEQLYFALNGGLTLNENLAATVSDFEVEVDSGGIPKKRTVFKLNSSTSVTQVVVGKVDNLTNTSAYPTGAVFVTWTQGSEGIIVNHITGLVANSRYRIRVTAYN